jgi:steroid delta-isomerase-like uncharacterized protein
MTPAELFQHYTDAWNRHDAAGIVAAFAEHGTYTDPTTAGPLAGAAIAAYAQSLWDAFPDLSFETVSLNQNDQGLVSAEWLMKGTNTGPIMGLPPYRPFHRTRRGRLRPHRRRQDPLPAGIFRCWRCTACLGT